MKRCKNVSSNIGLGAAYAACVCLVMVSWGCGDGGTKTGPICGNNIAESGQACDGEDLRGETCASQGYVGGFLYCLADCSGFDTSQCTSYAVCGDNIAQTGEACDGTDLRGETCQSLGYEGGTLACMADCSDFYTGNCTGVAAECGNNIAETGEACDGTDLRGETCESLGFDGGTLACMADCSDFYTGDCTSVPVCGNNVIDPGEVCDGTDLAGQTCEGLGYDGGELACRPDCSGFDTSRCTSSAECGNNIKEIGEVCDGTDLDGETCQSLGYEGGGTLACRADCKGFDVNGCISTAVCGNNIKETGEICDGTDLAGQTCQSFGFDGGTLACKADCSGFDVSGCTMVPLCGNNVIDPGEACDGTNLNHESCQSLGFDGGTLACMADCSDFDTSGCFNVPAEWRCNPAFYGSGDGCDCGCGAWDPDCGDETAASCDWCNALGSCGTGACPSNIKPTENWTCTVPAGWTCNPDWYGSGDGCHCGCGALDPDCTDVTADACDVCSGPGSCGVGSCPSVIAPNNNAICTGPACGNNIIEAGEVCDGTNLNNESCQSLGFHGGTLACLADCSGFDTSGCFNVPAEWRCNNAFYGDGICDCGCGALDPDCADETDASCEYCNMWGSCGVDSCNGANDNIDPLQNWTCTVPAQWTCSPIFYGDGDCDCGCGALDPDCLDVTVDACDFCSMNGSCSSDPCPGTINPFDNSTCTPSICGNNVIDPGEVCDGSDLGGETCESLGFAGGTLGCLVDCSGFDTSACEVPAEWRCDPAYFGANDGCDCGCGAWDPDCDDESAASCDFCNDWGSCGVDFCGGANDNIHATQNWTCTVPSQWTCSPIFYGAYGCDCGCGALDPACVDMTVDACDYCSASGSCGTGPCPANIDPTDNAFCSDPVCGNNIVEGDEVCDGTDLGGVTCVTLGYEGGTLTCLPDCSGFDTSGCIIPSTWRCHPSFFGSGDGCDCGCGAWDPDCDDETADSCDWCNMSGSCGVASCSSADNNIDPDKNWTCTVPAQWTCPESFYGAYGCDCGCGALDPACSSTNVDACDYCDAFGSCGLGPCPSNIDPFDNAVCI